MKKINLSIGFSVLLCLLFVAPVHAQNIFDQINQGIETANDVLDSLNVFDNQSSSNQGQQSQGHTIGTATFSNSSTSNVGGIAVANHNYGSLPRDYAEFKERCQTMARTPEGALKMYFDAVFSYIDPNTRVEGQKMLRYIMHEGENWDSLPSFSTFVSRLKDPSMTHIFRSFAVGTSPANGYEMSPHNYQIQVLRVTPESDHTVVALRSTGADSERLVRVQQFSDGLWYVINNASTYVGVRPPTNIVDNSHDADYD